MKLKIYFKSGNVVTIRNVVSWEVGGNGVMDSISITHKKPYFWQIKSRLIVKSMNLNNVDCITEH